MTEGVECSTRSGPAASKAAPGLRDAVRERVLPVAVALLWLLVLALVLFALALRGALRRLLPVRRPDGRRRAPTRRPGPRARRWEPS